VSSAIGGSLQPVSNKRIQQTAAKVDCGREALDVS